MNEWLYKRVELVVEWSIERDDSLSRVYVNLNAVKVDVKRKSFAPDRVLVHRGFHRGFRLL